MTMNPQAAAVLAAFAELPPFDIETITPDEMRAGVVPAPCDPLPAVTEVRDLVLNLPGREIAARLYLPEEASDAPPLTLYYHGGGWVVCTLDTHDALCRALARDSGSAVLSVDYRLAPETPFPGPLDDCYDALLWAYDHATDIGVDGERLAVAGDSAGGNLAAAVAICARDKGGPDLRHQLLLYPVTDTDFDTRSYRRHGDNILLPRTMMAWFWQQYIGDPANAEPLAAPLRHHDLSRLPPATVIVAEYDPLRDEGLAYAEALRKAGGQVHEEEAMGMIHGFMSMPGLIPDAWPAIARAGNRLRDALC